MSTDVKYRKGVRLFMKSILQPQADYIKLGIGSLLFLLIFFSVVDYHYARVLIVPVVFIGLWKIRLLWNLREVICHPLSISILLFLLFFLLSLIWSDNRSYGVGLMKSYALLLAVPILVQLIDSFKFQRLALYAYSFGVLKTSLEYWLIHFGIFNAYPNPLVVANGYSYIYVGLLLSPMVLFWLDAMIKKGSLPVDKVFWGCTSLISIITIFMMRGRGAQLAFLAGLLVFMLLSLRRYKWMTGAIFTVVLVGLLLINYQFNETFRFRVDQAVKDVHKVIYQNDYHTSGGIRLALWKVGGEIIAEHPFGGTGIGGQYLALEQKMADAKYKDITFIQKFAKSHYHNEYIEMGVQGGITGLVLFISLFMSLMYSLWRNQVNIGLGFGVVALVMTALLTHNFFGISKTIYFLVLMFSMISVSTRGYHANKE